MADISATVVEDVAVDSSVTVIEDMVVDGSITVVPDGVCSASIAEDVIPDDSAMLVEDAIPPRTRIVESCKSFNILEMILDHGAACNGECYECDVSTRVFSVS